MILLGWLTVISVLAPASLYVLNRLAPSQTDHRVKAHCLLGFVSLVVSLAYFAQTWTGVISLSNGLSLGLLLVTVSLGMVLRFLNEAGVVRYHAASFHSAMALALLLALLAYFMESGML
jgi:hypothetical protein